MTQDYGFQSRLAAARDGDAVAWSRLYHDVAPLVIGYLRAQRLPDAEDVAGEVLLEVVRDLHRFEGDADNLRSWVLAIAHHRLLDARRKAARRPRPAEPVAGHATPIARDDPEAETLSALAFGRLEGLCSALTEDQRNVLLLRVVGDLSIAQVATITGKRPGAVKQLQRRAAAVLRRQLETANTDVALSPGTSAGATAAAMGASGLAATSAAAATTSAAAATTSAAAATTSAAAATGGGLLLGAKLAAAAGAAAVLTSGAVAATGTLPDPAQTFVADVAETVSIELPRPDGPPPGVPGPEGRTPGPTGPPAPEPDRRAPEETPAEARRPDDLPADEPPDDRAGEVLPTPEDRGASPRSHPTPPAEITPTAGNPSPPVPSEGRSGGG